MALLSHAASLPQHHAYGVGATPLVLRAVLGNRWRVRPYVDFGAGFLSFNRPTPVETARRLNLVLQLGAGIQIFRGRNRALRTGFWFHHFSNVRMAPGIPAVDHFVVYTTYSIFP